MKPLALALLLAAAPAAAQPAPEEPVAAAAEGPVLRAGTRVPMVTLERVSSKNARQGQRVKLEAADEVRVDGLLVIPKGASGMAEVARVVETGTWGKAGKLRLRVLWVEVAGHRLRIDGEAADKGKSGAAPILIAAPLVGIMGGWISGTSAVFEAGSSIDGFVYDDVPLIPAP